MEFKADQAGFNRVYPEGREKENDGIIIQGYKIKKWLASWGIFIHSVRNYFGLKNFGVGLLN